MLSLGIDRFDHLLTATQSAHDGVTDGVDVTGWILCVLAA